MLSIAKHSFIQRSLYKIWLYSSLNSSICSSLNSSLRSSLRSSILNSHRVPWTVLNGVHWTVLYGVHWTVLYSNLEVFLFSHIGCSVCSDTNRVRACMLEPLTEVYTLGYTLYTVKLSDIGVHKWRPNISNGTVDDTVLSSPSVELSSLSVELSSPSVELSSLSVELSWSSCMFVSQWFLSKWYNTSRYMYGQFEHNH